MVEKYNRMGERPESMAPSRLCCAVTLLQFLLASTSRTCQCDWYQWFWNGADSEWCICPQVDYSRTWSENRVKHNIYFISNINHDKFTTVNWSFAVCPRHTAKPKKHSVKDLRVLHSQTAHGVHCDGKSFFAECFLSCMPSAKTDARHKKK